MKANPVATGQRHANECKQHIDNFRQQAQQRGLPFPDNNQLISVGINEPPIWEALQQTVDYTVAYLDTLHSLGLIGGALNLSVGWPANNGPDSPVDWTPFESVHAAILRGNHYLILHEYWDHSGPQNNWKWWAGRYLQCPWSDVKIIMGECGVDEFVRDATTDPMNRGWKGHLTPDQYMAQLATYDQALQQDARIHSAMVFLSDYASRNWASFDCDQIYPQWVAYAQSHPTTQLPVIVPPVTPPPTPAISIRLPFDGSYPITQPYGVNAADYVRFNLKGHNGIDYGTPIGTPILAVDDGEVIESSTDADGFGEYVKLRHAWGESIYAHLSSRMVLTGDVGKGQLIGYSGNTGNTTGPHLHFSIRINPYNRADGWQGYSDPAPYLQGQTAQPSGLLLDPFFGKLTDIELLARLIYGEARGEDGDGMPAVGHVAINRAAQPGWWGNNLREVILKPYQFSCFNEVYRDSLITPSEDVWNHCVWFAYWCIERGDKDDPSLGATHYHNVNITPDWAATLTPTVTIGQHIFYK